MVEYVVGRVVGNEAALCPGTAERSVESAIECSVDRL